MHDPVFLVRAIVYVHVFFAFISLTSMFVPMVTKKGGRLHRLFGRIYVRSMIVSTTTAIVASLYRIFGDIDATDRTKAAAVFMIFLSLFALSAIAHGLNCLRHKQRSTPLLTRGTVGWPIGVGLFGLAAIIGGIFTQHSVLIYFPAVGLFVSVQQIQYWQKPPRLKMHWWYEHMSGMFTACIGTATAFLVQAVPRLVDAPWTRSLWVWLAPTLIFTPLLSIWTKKYRQQFEGAR